MTKSSKKLWPGDLVEVRTPGEIAKTLDDAGTVDHLPFMPEMVDFCGQRFRVTKRVVKVCASGMKTGMFLGEFRTDDVVVLNVRCSGAEHDNCQKGCVIFWREAWLRKVTDESSPASVHKEDRVELRKRLRTKQAPNTYFCQASELLRATRKLKKWEKYVTWVGELRAGNCNVFEMTRRICIFSYWKIRFMLFGHYGKGKIKTTPTDKLDLKPGEWVEVKPLNDIFRTLDRNANNRGLWFSPPMRSLCGQRHRVERRIEKLIVDGTGEMRKMNDSVFLEGSFCGCPHIAFGGCSRCEFVYWREIWLRRCNGNSGAH